MHAHGFCGDTQAARAGLGRVAAQQQMAHLQFAGGQQALATRIAWDYAGKSLLGVGLALVIGEWLIRASSRQQAQQTLALQGR